MQTLDEYARKYKTIRMRREDGILEMRIHTNDGPWRLSRTTGPEMEEAFLDIGRDRENQVVILCGTGDEFTGPTKLQSHAEHSAKHGRPEHWTPDEFDKVYWTGKNVLMNLLNIEVPMISAINGPALRHAEIPLLCDIVLASEEATIQDSGHFVANNIPGDGVHVIFPLLLGPNRGRYFLLTGQTLTAAQALEFGLVSEVLPKQDLLPRAWALAREIMKKSPLVRRYTRVLLTEDLKRRMQEQLGYGLALEGLGKISQNV